MAEESTLRVRNIQASGKCTVAKLEWLFHCITSKQMLSWTPADLLYATADVEQKLSMQYDEFGDSYTQPATEESLRYVFEQVNRKVCIVIISDYFKILMYFSLKFQFFTRWNSEVLKFLSFFIDVPYQLHT